MRTIVVDTETTGLGSLSRVIEVAAIDLESGRTVADFVPHTPDHVIEEADPEAMRINRWHERGCEARMLSEHATRIAYRDLAAVVNRQTWAGSNPRFDLDMLNRLAVLHMTHFVPHYRLLDVASVACGYFREVRPLGLADVCDRLGAGAPDHSAMGDAVATRDVILEMCGWEEQA